MRRAAHVSSPPCSAARVGFKVRVSAFSDIAEPAGSCRCPNDELSPCDVLLGELGRAGDMGASNSMLSKSGAHRG